MLCLEDPAAKSSRPFLTCIFHTPQCKSPDFSPTPIADHNKDAQGDWAAETQSSPATGSPSTRASTPASTLCMVCRLIPSWNIIEIRNAV